jgi:hypothetical protein
MNRILVRIKIDVSKMKLREMKSNNLYPKRNKIFNKIGYIIFYMPNIFTKKTQILIHTLTKNLLNPIIKQQI